MLLAEMRRSLAELDLGLKGDLTMTQPMVCWVWVGVGGGAAAVAATGSCVAAVEAICRVTKSTNPPKQAITHRAPALPPSSPHALACRSC